MSIVKRSSLIASLITLILVIGLFATPASTHAQSGAKIVAVPSQAAQANGQEVTLQLAGFAANEPVTLWNTYPDYTVMPMGTYNVSSAGVTHVKVPVDGTMPVGLHHFSARGNDSGAIAIVAFEVLPAVVNISQGVSIEVTTGMGGKQGSHFGFVGRGYHNREPISIWITRPDGTVEYVGTKRTHQGNWGIALSFDEKDPVGLYYLTGYGNMSGRTGIAEFIVTGGNYTSAVGGAELVASPTRTRQLETVQVHGMGFAPGEVVSFWITMADGTVWDGGKFIVNEDGAFMLAGTLPALIPDNGFPIGITTFTAYGNASKLIATTSVELWAGSEF